MQDAQGNTFVITGSSDNTCHKILGSAAPVEMGGVSDTPDRVLRFLQGPDGTLIPGTRGHLGPVPTLRASPLVNRLSVVFVENSIYTDKSGKSYLIGTQGNNRLVKVDLSSLLIVQHYDFPHFIRTTIRRGGSRYDDGDRWYYQIVQEPDDAYAYVTQNDSFYRLRLSDFHARQIYYPHNLVFRANFRVSYEKDRPYLYMFDNGTNSKIIKVNALNGNVLKISESLLSSNRMALHFDITEGAFGRMIYFGPPTLGRPSPVYIQMIREEDFKLVRTFTIESSGNTHTHNVKCIKIADSTFIYVKQRSSSKILSTIQNDPSTLKLEQSGNWGFGLPTPSYFYSSIGLQLQKRSVSGATIEIVDVLFGEIRLLSYLNNSFLKKILNIYVKA